MLPDILSKENFAKLSVEIHARLKQENWWQKHGFEFFIFFLRCACFALSFLIFSQDAWFFKIVGMIFLSYFFYGIGITGTHETRHSSFTSSEYWNRLWAYFFSDFWAGQSNLWWHNRHVVVHHVYTNVPGVEPKQFYFPWINRYIYFFVVPYFVVFWLFIHSILFLWKEKRYRDLSVYFLVQAAGWLFHIWLFTLILSTPFAILTTFIMRSLFAPLFVHIAVFNHIGLEDPRKRLPWLPHQTRTTRNLKPHWILTGMGGNAFIDCHIEHHLFPKISNRGLSKIRPIVMKYVKAEGYKYVEETYLQCLKHCIQYYDQIFDEPVAL